jgi:hypothetical protein
MQAYNDKKQVAQKEIKHIQLEETKCTRKLTVAATFVLRKATRLKRGLVYIGVNGRVVLSRQDPVS